ncbi:MAG TPA: PAS domain-containing protein, partial [Longimicrobiales bacterium]
MEQTPFSPSADGRGERSSNTAESLLPLLIRSVLDYAIFLLDPQGRVVSWNEGAERIKGYSADEILGRHFSVFYPQDSAASGFPQYELEVAAAAGRFEDEGWRLRKDGSRFWANVVITALRDETGTLVGFAKVTRDLTARRAAEEQGRRLAAEEATRAEAERRSAELLRVNDLLQDQAAELEAQNEQLQAQALELELQQEQLQELTARLQRSNEELQATLRQAEAARDDARRAEESTTAILASITDPFVVYDADWRFRYCNPRAVAVMQRAGPVGDAELSGKVVWAAFPDLAGTPLQEAMVRAMEERVPVETEAYYAKPRTWLQLHADPLPDGGLAVSWKDTTQRRRAQAAVQYLSEAGAILSSSLDYEKTLAAVARLVVPELADWCGIEL